ncbi:MAG: endonuclease III [Kiritimatiellae bacterium]|nr:endonuclease III [Kiritimatiellia bacterium]
MFRIVRRPADVKKLSVMEIERLIYPVGFYRVKARQLKKLAEVLEQDFGGNIPTTLEGLCRLPGVGRKTANLVLIDAFGKPGICVDTHVHRISNRLGIVQTRTPFETEMRLRQILPPRYWKTWNSLLVFFGQTICRPVSPKCTVCPLTKFCRWVGVESGCSSR